MCKTVLWNPWNNLLEQSSDKYGVIILNVPLDFKKFPDVLERLWSRGKHFCLLLMLAFILTVTLTATVRVTVDGGTNRWVSWLREHGYDLKNMKPPHLVTGDMDSISKDVLQYYMTTNQTTQVLHTPDQYETDYTKALMEINKFLSERSMMVCLIVFMFECTY